MTRSRVALSMVLLAVMGGLAMAQKNFDFFRPETFKHRVTVPRRVVPLVTRDLRTKPGCDEKASPERPTFEAWRINLGAHRRALLVRGYSDCLHWANRFWFFVVLKSSAGYRLVLHGGSESLIVRNTITHRFPDLETASSTAAGIWRDLYKFNGQVYRADLCTFTNAGTRKSESVACRSQ